MTKCREQLLLGSRDRGPDRTGGHESVPFRVHPRGRQFTVAHRHDPVQRRGGEDGSEHLALLRNDGAGAFSAAQRLRVDPWSGGIPGPQDVLFKELGERIRDVAQGPDGRLYLITDSGRLLRVNA